jgi:hypothetical protein
MSSVLETILQPKKKYHLLAKFNEEVFELDTDDLKEGILSIKPVELLTDAYFTVTKGDDETDRRVNRIQGKRIFQDETSLEIFTNNFLLD